MMLGSLTMLDQSVVGKQSATRHSYAAALPLASSVSLLMYAFSPSTTTLREAPCFTLGKAPEYTSSQARVLPRSRIAAHWSTDMNALCSHPAMSTRRLGVSC